MLKSEESKFEMILNLSLKSAFTLLLMKKNKKLHDVNVRKWLCHENQFSSVFRFLFSVLLSWFSSGKNLWSILQYIFFFFILAWFSTIKLYLFYFILSVRSITYVRESQEIFTESSHISKKGRTTFSRFHHCWVLW